MHVSPNPTMDQVSHLLGQCGLPSDDILPEYLPNFVLARDGESAVGVAGLQVFGSTALVRSVAVVPTHRCRGLGTKLLDALEQRARSQGVKQLFLLTNDAQAFFMAHGYREFPRCSAPAEIRGCSQFGSSCCEAATLMVKQADNHNAMEPKFDIEVLEQGWLVPSEPEEDLCTHGRLRLVIGGREVLDEQESYGVCESALAMLRTLESDHRQLQRVAERMVFHGCGTILMMGCPIGADFSVRHGPEGVTIGDVVRYDTTDETQAVRFPGLSVTVSEEEYRRAVLDFARRAREPFAGVVKRFADDFDATQYREFWEEFDRTLARHEPGAV